jgi:hypothetical protein
MRTGKWTVIHEGANNRFTQFWERAYSNMNSKSAKRFRDLRIYEIGKWTLGYARSHLFQLSVLTK